MDAFHERKRRVLTILASDQVDRSRKGGLDAPILGLVESINGHPAFFTTSSCSGRITLFLEPIDQNSSAESPNNIQGCAKKKPHKKGGDWLFVSHENVEFNDLWAAINEKYNQSVEGLLVFRFEPFILALECISVLAAQKLVTCAVGAGFRESGITSIGKRVIIAIRCSIRLEVPIARMGRLMVSEEYLKFLTELSNYKMHVNRERTSRFLSSFTDQFKLRSTCQHAAVLQLNNNGTITDQSVFSANSENECPLTALSKTLQKKLLVLGNRQKRILERLSNLESQLRSPLQISVDEGTPNKGFLGVAFSNTILSSGSIKWLHRWGHSTCTIPSAVGTIRQSSLLIFGGYGGVGRHARLSDTLILDRFNGTVKLLGTIEPPSPRMGHRAFVLDDKMWVIGGREDPSTPLQEVMVLDINTLQWNNVKTTGAKFLPRHRHAGASVGSRIYIHGGLGRSVAYGDLLVLDTHLRHWSLLVCRGDIPSPRYSHSLNAIGNKLYMFGGFDGATIFGDIYTLDISTCTWTKETTIGDQPVPRFSHSCTVFGQYMALLGGCPITEQANELFILDTKCMSWKQYKVQVPSNTVLVRHTVTVLENKLIVVGGGTSCFAFGTSFSNPFLIDIGCHIYEANGEHLLKDRPDIVSSVSQQSTLAINALEDTKMKTSQKAMVLTSRTGIREEVSTKKNGWVFQLDSVLAKIGKDALKTLGWMDRERKVQITCMGAKVAFPITLVAANQIICMKQLHLEKENDILALNVEDGASGTNRTQAKLALERCIINGGEAREVEVQVSDTRNCAVSPYTIMRERISLLLRDNNLPIHLVEELPARWECLGDMAVLPASSLISNSWASLGDVLWTTLAEILNVSRIARQGTVASTGTRDSTLQILYGNNGWVMHRENGIIYSFDATKCMFSSGNVSERIRVSRMNCAGETVVDLFAGIGYFTLPFLVRSGAEMVYACEWNPRALLALRHNLHVNAVDARCVVIEGDNRITAPQGIANRVCLGLLPTSEESWSVAVKALRPDGGMLHVHANVKDTEEKAWAEYLRDKIINYALSQGRSWHVQITHMERVKWYAPHIRHLVADVDCSYEGTKKLM